MASTARQASGTAGERTAGRTRKPESGPTRERLVAGARVSFARHGFAATRVADIVNLAGTSHGTFYTYFDDKRGVLLALTQQAAGAIYGAAVAPLAAGPDESPRDAIHARLTVLFRVYSEWWDVVRTWDHASAIHPEVDELRARIRSSIVQQLCALLTRERERLGEGLDLEITAVALTAMVEEFAGRWSAGGRALGTAEVDQLTSLVAGALYGSEAAGARHEDR
ncbi:MAG: TetR/AcrR family transcriptional regulator [Solirubrobacteraceae bacterium]|jgi:AcrR family transcriptional regulator